MDVLLRITDDLVMDRIYSTLLPSNLLPATSPLLPLLRLGSTTPPPSYSTSPLSTYPLQLASLLPRDAILRQFSSLFIFSLAGSFFLYFSVSSLSYFYLFDRRLEHHPRFLVSQVRKEIHASVTSMPWMAALIVPFFVAEIRGNTKLYDGWPGEGRWGLGPWTYMAVSVVIFLAIADYAIYWIHRWLHIPVLYKRLHKPHHRWLVPTPFASLAFHPVDGFSQSFPYHAIPFFLPINKWLYIGLFIGVQVWTIFIHDGDMISGHFLERFINSPAHHTLHHLYFTCNYGQYFTWADYYGGSYRAPKPELDPIHESLKMMRKKGLLPAEAEDEIEGQEKLGEKDAEGSDSGYEGSGAEVAGKGDGAGEVRKRSGKGGK